MKLYGFPRSRSLRALWALEEAGLSYEYDVVNLAQGDARRPPFVDLNPGAKVPVLVDGELVLSESAAICMYIADQVPEKNLVPPAGTADRYKCEQWCFFAIGELEQPLWTANKHKFVFPETKRVPAIIDTAQWEFQRVLKTLTKGLGDRDYILGNQFSVADIVIAHTLAWARYQQWIVDNPVIDAYADRCLKRPAQLEAQQIDASRLEAMK